MKTGFVFHQQILEELCITVTSWIDGSVKLDITQCQWAKSLTRRLDFI